MINRLLVVPRSNAPIYSPHRCLLSFDPSARYPVKTACPRTSCGNPRATFTIRIISDLNASAWTRTRGQPHRPWQWPTRCRISGASNPDGPEWSPRQKGWGKAVVRLHPPDGIGRPPPHPARLIGWPSGWAADPYGASLRGPGGCMTDKPKMVSRMPCRSARNPLPKKTPAAQDGAARRDTKINVGGHAPRRTATARRPGIGRR